MLASISIAALFLGAFIWNIKKGQYEDEAGAPIRILFDETAFNDEVFTLNDELKQPKTTR
jgi:cbb3-type cytochrome oxidase maturation protein